MIALPARPLATALCVIMAVALPGCSGGGDPQTAGSPASPASPGVTATAESDEACRLLQGPELRAATGVRPGRGDGRQAGRVVGCTWKNDGAPFSADLDIHRGNGAEQYDLGVKNLREVGSFGEERRLEGIGERASVFEQQAGDVSSAFLLAVRGEDMVQLSVVGVLRGATASEAAEQLARLVVERL